MSDRKVLEQPLDKDGYFAVPEKITPELEVLWTKTRMRAVRLYSYSDQSCGIPQTYDPSGAYLCGGLESGDTITCNMMEEGKCLSLGRDLPKPHAMSCKYWEIRNVGDPELKACPKGGLTDAEAAFGETENKKGFGCIRCEYGQQKLPSNDSEGRSMWCKEIGMPFGKGACCGLNDPTEKSEDRPGGLHALVRGRY